MDQTTSALMPTQGRYVALHGECDLERRAELRVLFDAVTPDRPLTIDLQQVTYGDSTFLSTLALLKSRFRGMPITLLGPCKPLKRLLSMTRFDSIFNIVDAA